MAVDVTTLQPLKPYAGSAGGQKIAPIVPFLAGSTSAVYRSGDVVVLTSGLAVVDNSDPTTAVLGVVTIGLTTAAAVTDKDFVGIALAAPGRIFEANWTAKTGTADDTFTASDGGSNFNLDEIDVDPGSATLNYAVIDSGAATGVATVLGASPDQIRGQNYVDGTTVNPRVLFQFNDGVLFAALD